MAVTELNYFFDINSIRNDIRKIIFNDIDFDKSKYREINQISFRTSDWATGIGPVYDSTEQIVSMQSSLTTSNPKLKNSYIEKIIKKVEGLALEENINVGRVRILRLMPKTCTVLHVDLSENRFHIPIETNDDCFFVSDDIIYRMPIEGRLYRFKTNSRHAAVNASNEQRLHLVFDTFNI